MGALLEKPAFWMFLMLALIVGVVVLVVFLASRNAGKAPAAGQPVQLPAPSGAPGWYPQPDGTLRYWDGRAWTEHTAAPGTPPAG